MKMSRLFKASMDDVAKLAGTSQPTMKALVEAGLIKCDVAGNGDGKYRYYVFTMEQAREAKRVVDDYKTRFGRTFLKPALAEAGAKTEETEPVDELAALRARVAQLETHLKLRTDDVIRLADQWRWMEAMVCKLYADLGVPLPVRE